MPLAATASPIVVIADQVRERVRRDGADLGSDAELVGRYVRDEVRRYSERALGGSVPLLEDEAVATRQVVASLTGFVFFAEIPALSTGIATRRP